MSDQNAHVYLAVACRTKGCNVYLVLKHVGLFDPTKTYAPNNQPALVRATCNVCLAVDDYTFRDLVVRRGPAPPVDFSDAF